MKFIKCVICAVLCVLWVSESNASHLAGGNITYRNIGPNQYIITLTMYQDCSGANIQPFNPVGNVNVWYRNNCGSAPIAIVCSPLAGTGVEVPTPCVDDPSRCNGGTRYGIRQFQWEGTVTFPTSTTSACNEWTLTAGATANTGWNARNPNNSLAGFGNFFIDSYVNNNVTPGNNSARFASFQVPAYCVSEPVTVVFDVTEPDGDSVVYSLVPAQSAFNTPMAYQAGLSSSVPASVLNNVININPNNGNLSFFSTQPQTAVFVLKVDEYRAGTLVGYVKIDVQVILGIGRYCDNVQPGFRFDSISVACGTWNDTLMRVPLRSRVQCNTIARDASEFRLYNPSGQLIQLESATPVNCDNQDRTMDIDLILTRPLDENGFYYLVTRNGTDGNTVGNQCQKFMFTFDTMVVEVRGCPEYKPPMLVTNVSVDTINPNALIYQWDEPDTLNTSWFLAYNLYRAKPGENIFAIDKRFHQEMDVTTRIFRDVYSPDLPKDSPIRFNINLVLINGKENARSNTVQSIQLKNEPQTVPDDETVSIQWTRYNGWNLPEYVVQMYDQNKLQEGWVDVFGPTADTSYVHTKPLPKGQYKLRVVSRNPSAPFLSYSNPIDFEVPGREVEIPNVITPNGDGANDKFVITNLEYYPGARLFIFNRWGQQMYVSMDYKNDWDAEGMTAGNYFYQLFVYDQAVETEYKGTLKVIR